MPDAQLALFDLDNTLCDRQHAFDAWLAEFSGRHRLTESEMSWLQLIDHDGARPRSEFFAMVRDRLNLGTPVPELIAGYYDIYLANYACYAGVLDSLRSLKHAGWTVAVVTNGSGVQERKIWLTGLGDVLDGWSVSDAVGWRKPAVGIFSDAARNCRVELAGWMTGDGPDTDIAGGKNAGLRTIWVSRGRQWSEDSYQPDVVAADALAGIDRLMRSP